MTSYGDFMFTLKKHLQEEFANGNLKHTFSVSDEKYIEVFLQVVRDNLWVREKSRRMMEKGYK